MEAGKDAHESNEIATVDGAGNSNAVLNYQIKDSIPFAGVSYYRLKQVDFNGEFTYSDIQAVNTPTLWQNEIIVSPNPVVGTANVLLDPVLYQNPNIEIRDLQGRVVKNIGRVEIKGFNQVQVDMTDMKAGLYFVYVQEAGRVAVSRVIRN